MENVRFTFDPSAKPMQPVMADSVAPCLGRGVIARNVERVSCCNMALIDSQGQPAECENVKQFEWKNDE